MSGQWMSSGWIESSKLNVLSFDLRKYKYRDTGGFHVEDFNQNSIDNLLPLDQRIFDAYWRNSKAGFIETIESCNRNYLFKKYVDKELIGYAILGSTRNFSFLQRFGISKDYQNNGYGFSLLNDVVNFAKSKKFVNIRLNTQPNNTAAQSLYLKKGFKLTNTNYIIFSSS
jgi:ribosomal protein S18 acetylase RimI-like enzyme